MEKLRRQLLMLSREHNLVSVKGGTEVEAMTFPEIRLMRNLSSGILPMTVKIGGPEARNDIRFMLAIGIDTILAPMIESAYSLRNFVRTMQECDPAGKATLAVNIETITAFYNLNSITAAPEFGKVSHVTVGRSDLSGSMNKGVEDSEVTGSPARSSKSPRTGLFHLGRRTVCRRPPRCPGVHPGDTINTRHMTFPGFAAYFGGHRGGPGLGKAFYQLVMAQYPERRSSAWDGPFHRKQNRRTRADQDRSHLMLNKYYISERYILDCETGCYMT
jgi:hypothetical protein